jgi:hypothetical protein
LPDGELFPVSVKESGTNMIPSKLLIRDFHCELRLVIKELRRLRKTLQPNGGAVFFGPSGIGKSWSSMSVLVDELKDSSSNNLKKSVVYFDATGKKAFVFGKNRNVMLRGRETPNDDEIPELRDKDTVLIYDASRGTHTSLPGLPCEILIFSSPNAGNFKQVADNNGLLRFVCPSWKTAELIALEHGYGDRQTEDQVVSRCSNSGGNPRAVVANPLELAFCKAEDARILLRGVRLWFAISAMDTNWPSSLLQAKYSTDEVARTPREAFDKYIEHNVIWDYSCERAKALVYEEYKRMGKQEKEAFENWLKAEPKASALFAYHFEYIVGNLFASSKEQDVEWKVLTSNDGLEKKHKEKLNIELKNVERDLNWKYPTILRVETAKSLKNDVSELAKLNDEKVMYRLPDEFPIIDYFNPPNNCFSLGVGDHTIKLDPAMELCKTLPSKQINLIYLTTSENYPKINRWQSFKRGNSQQALGKLPTKEIKALSGLVQFCMRFKRI